MCPPELRRTPMSERVSELVPGSPGGTCCRSGGAVMRTRRVCPVYTFDIAKQRMTSVTVTEGGVNRTTSFTYIPSHRRKHETDWCCLSNTDCLLPCCCERTNENC